ncbi:LysR family transcriptional regulator [Vibrio parahaemolyticus]|uniref:LysR family transcriptional regulator n=1 Tax=Vibrio parahaemolyticus TaxID=670 RepID=UPI00045205F0|nr:LysR family transcriptional regulator [Vibrio parahaemolyticus]EJG0873708.1 LysR family transcriptional regulator [Vibrio parahaemolyticus O3]EJG0902366.1 LysR family transcriptional regulator [Vibrio parahaemolyticus O3:K56]EJG1074307.1 LysR family transcriptional regulator [Vibrio parahaemolyticus O1:K56]EGQ8273277.1 LysR family transcriptional regulator [Vibrio parahaemolyticus]EGQ8939052.1 LysR family transcriptional regulator [Vibrio parahaemolyticus]
MNLRQLEVFYAIMQAGTVSGAARLLHVSQPNVTRVLAHTEQHLGFALFERVKGRLVPTQEAKALLPEAEKVYQQLGQFRSLTNKVKQGTQHLRVGAPPVLAAHLLAPTVALLSKEHGISFELLTANRDELCSGLLKHELDVAIAFGEETPPAIMGHVLLKENLALIAPKSAAIPAEKTVILEELISHDLPIIGLDSRDPLGLLLHQTLSARDEHYQHAITVRSYSAAAELVKHQAGFAIVDPWTAKQYRQDDAVSVHALEPNMSFSVSILFAEHTPQSIATKQFITALKQQMV